VANYPQYHVVEVFSLEPIQLPNSIIGSGVTGFVLEQQNAPAGVWSSAVFTVSRNSLQAYNNANDMPNIYVVGSPWLTTAAAQAAAIADYTKLCAFRDGAVSQVQLGNQITSSAYVNLITTVAGPG
jgi:hypothetical protein